MQRSATVKHPPSAPDTPAARLVRELFGVIAVQRTIGRCAAPAALGLQGLSILGTLRREGPLRAAELAELQHVDPSVISRQVGALANSGYVERTTDPHDGRAQLLALTDEGLDVLRAAYEQMIGLLGDALAGWKPADVDALAEALGRLRESVVR